MTWGKKLMIAAAAVVGTVIVAYFLALVITNQQHDAVLAQLDQLVRTPAEPIESPSTLARSDRGSPTNDSVHQFEMFFSAYEAFRQNDPEVIALVQILKDEHPEAWSTETRERLTVLLDTHGDLYENLKKAIAGGGPAHTYDFSESLDKPIPHATYMWEMGRLLSARALLSMGRGDTDDAVDDLRTVLRLSEVLAPEPVPLSQAVRMNLAATAAQGIAQAFPPGTMTDRQRVALVESLAHTDHREGIARALVGEALIGDESWSGFADILRASRRDGGMIYNGLVTLYCSPVARPLVNLDQRAHAESILRVAELAPMAYFEAYPALQLAGAAEEDFPFLYLYARFFPGIGQRLLVSQAEHETLMDLTILGITIEGCRTNTAAYPNALSDIADMLPDKLPRDPFTGQPYIYRLMEDSFVLYSLGQNRQDDGGRHDWREGDIVWRGVEEGTP